LSGFLAEVLPLRASPVNSPALGEKGGEVEIPSRIVGTKRLNAM
jgi:hypothetical protein